MRILVTGQLGPPRRGVVPRARRRRRRDRRARHPPLAAHRRSSARSPTARPSARRVAGVDAILHAATLHKPHVGSHTRQEFVETNITGTLTLLEEAVAAGVSRVIYTSTTSAFGRALTPAPGAPANWITEDVAPVPRNIYGVTKVAAENVCELVHRDHGLPILILRTSRFFPEADDRDDVRAAYEDANLKVNELLYRRADLEDIVTAHRLALEQAPSSASAATSSAPRRRSRARTSPSCTPTRRPWWSVTCRIASSTTGSAGGCSERSSASTSTPPPAATSAGRRATTSRTRSSGSPRGEEWRSELTLEVGAKGYHAESTGPYTIR